MIITYLVQGLGVGLVLVALMDVFLTVLHARNGLGLLSPWFNKGIWQFFRSAALAFPAHKDRILSLAGPMLLVLIASLWAVLLVVGFGLIVWPALGTGILASSGATPTNFAAALYYSAYSLTTLGTGDLVPQTPFYRLLMVFEATAGFSVLTLTLTYFMSVYSALVRRNTFAMALHHRTAATGDPAELLAGLTAGGNVSVAQQELATILQEVANLFESHQFYPVLHYFRFPEVHYALARMLFIVMDAASLTRTAVDKEAHRQLVMGSAARGLQTGGQQLLRELAETFLGERQPEQDQPPPEEDITQWRERYQRTAERLTCEGLTVSAAETGEDAYISLRRQWQPLVEAFAEHMAYSWERVSGGGSSTPENC